MILLLGGTSETAALAEAIALAGYRVLVSTATDAALDIGRHQGISRRSGRLDAAGFVALARKEGVQAIVDASHPYAVELHAEARSAAATLGLPYLRYIRPESAEASDVILAADHVEAAQAAASLGGTILLTTGSNNLKPYVQAAAASHLKLFARVLPHSDSMAACREAGLGEERVIARRGPFTVEQNREAIRRTRAKVLITKESGDAGGFSAKLEAARLEGCRVVVVGRPHEAAAPGEAFAEISGLVAALQKAVSPGRCAGEPEEATGPSSMTDAPKTHGRHYLPLGIDVAGMPCLVVGGGRIGTRKAMTLADAGAAVTVVAPEISEALRSAVAAGRVAWKNSRYSSASLEGFWFVVAATGDAEVNIQVGRDAGARRLLCCVASPGRFSRVVFPAVWRGEGLTVAVHSDGHDCARSKAARQEIAAVLRGRGRDGQKLCVLGLGRRDLPEEAFAALSSGTRRLPPGSGQVDDVGEVLFLSTCLRWECYFLSASPEAAARSIRGFVHEHCGVLLEAHREALYLKSGPGARHHLLRVASGLASSLVGETEVVSQIEAAAETWLSEDGSELARHIERALGDQKSIRGKSGLAPIGESWAGAAVSSLRRGLPDLRAANVLVIGRGQMGRAVAGLLSEAGTNFTQISSRSGLAPDSPDGGPALLDKCDAVVLAGAVPEEHRKILDAACRSGKLLVDLCGREMDCASPARMTGTDAARVAAAEMAAFELAITPEAPREAPGRLRLGGRASHLSLVQLEEARRFLAIALPGAECEVAKFDTPGDRDRKTPLPEVKDEDFFTRDIDDALLDGRIDIGIHSAKDLPSRLRPGLVVGALLPAFAPWEALVSRGDKPLAELPFGARIGTSSERRRQELLRLRPEVVPCDVRGDVPGRIAQLDAGKYDALILAAAGLVRLGLAGRIAQVFTAEEFPQTAGQGSLAFVVRESDARLRALLEPLNLGDRKGLPWA